MYKSFADLESGLDIFSKQFPRIATPGICHLLPPNRQNASFIMLKILPAILIHRTWGTNPIYTGW